MVGIWGELWGICIGDSDDDGDGGDESDGFATITGDVDDDGGGGGEDSFLL